MHRIEIKSKSILLGTFFFIAAVIVSLIIALDRAIPTYYAFLPVMPLIFGFCCILFSDVFSYVPQNLGVTIILGLFFVRNIITPLVMFLGNYTGVIYLNIENNTTPAIFLVSLETVAVFCAMSLRLKKIAKKCCVADETGKELSFKSLKKYFLVIMIVLFVLIVCDIIAPEMMDSYRTIFDIGEEHFANFEDSDIVRIYGTTFVKKLAIVLGRYIARALILIFPALIIAFTFYKNNLLYKLLGFFVCFVPLFYIAGGIARSLIYMICLFLLYNHCTAKTSRLSNKQLLPIVIGVIVAGFWWLYDYNSGELWSMLSGTLNAYFSGVNIVSGGFNLPNNMEYSMRYFINDFTSTIPFGGTIFGISYETVQSFFNSANYTFGQIPPTISMGNYYFGPALAPIYSIIFAILAVDSGNQLSNNRNMHPMKYIRLCFSVFQFSMGIVMYNIEITMIAVFSLILPMILIEKLSSNQCKNIEGK